MAGRYGIPIIRLSTGERYGSARELAKVLGVDHSTVTNHLRGRRMTLRKEIYRYAHEIEEDQI
jgi:DNA-binding MarR family transcriptional regulator